MVGTLPNVRPSVGEQTFKNSCEIWNWHDLAPAIAVPLMLTMRFFPNIIFVVVLCGCFKTFECASLLLPVAGLREWQVLFAVVDAVELEQRKRCRGWMCHFEFEPLPN